MREQLIDRILLKSRNEIAHGKLVSIDKKQFLTLYDDVLDLMNLFRNQISNAANTEAYKRNKDSNRIQQ